MQRAGSEIETLIGRSGAERVGIAFHDLATADALLINADEPFHPASTFKVCVMMELYRQAHEGRVDLDSRLIIKNQFASLVEGSPFSVDAADDSEQSLYRRLGESETLRELNRLMIVLSSNLATNLLVEVVSAARVTEFMAELGAPDLKVLRGPEDNRAYALGMNNVATARGLMQILLRLAEGSVVSEKASREMIDVLLGQQFNEGIPAGLPEGIPVAHKTGWNSRLYHDAGIVFPPDRAPFVLTIMTRGLPEETEAPHLAASVTRLLASAVGVR